MYCSYKTTNPVLFLWTGMLPYALYRSLSISKLLCKDGGGGGVGIRNEFRRWHLLRSFPFQGPKKLQGPPLQTPLVMDYSPIEIHTSRPIYTTGTLIVIVLLERANRFSGSCCEVSLPSSENLNLYPGSDHPAGCIF
jgi:hypothetical protein